MLQNNRFEATFFRKTITIHDLFSGSCSWPILNGAPFKTNFVWSFPISSHDHNGSKYQTHDERCVLGLASNYNIDSSVQLFVHVGEQARLIMPTHFMLSAAANQPEPGNLVTSVKSKFQENISCTNKPIGKLRCHHHHTIADLSLKDRERCGGRPWWWRRVGGGSEASAPAPIDQSSVRRTLLVSMSAAENDFIQIICV